MKILLVADKENTAIDRLCKYTIQAAPQHSYRLCYVHPKRPNEQQLQAFDEAYKWCDVIDFRYWKSAEFLKSMYDFSKKPKLLTHYNPYDIEKHQWGEYGINIVVNKDQARRIKGESYLVPLPVDFDFWEYQDDYSPEYTNNVIMVANRIQEQKGVLQAALAVKDAGLNFILVGRPSDPMYLQSIFDLFADVPKSRFMYYEGVSDEMLRKLYYQSGLHICNSIDNYESGTMPILEAMACGVPVLTRSVGHVPDIYDGTNLILNKNAYNDVDALKHLLIEYRNDYDSMLVMRAEAYKTIKLRNLEMYGYKYSKLYWKAYSHYNGNLPLVSVIMPTADNLETFAKSITHVLASDYPNFEILVCDDSKSYETENFIKQLKSVEISKPITIRHIRTTRYQISGEEIKKTYGLAHSRNVGIREAEGEYCFFVDDRMQIEPDAMRKFVEKYISYPNPLQNKLWLWGMKSGIKKGFVENFSFVHRKHIVDIGGFSDFIEQYGGLTQETRKKAERNGIKFEFVGEAQAQQLSKSHSKFKRLRETMKSKTIIFKLGLDYENE